jgi:hypothetical protein
MDHISGKKSSMGTIEASIDRAKPDEEPAKFPRKEIHFYGLGWPSK